MIKTEDQFGYKGLLVYLIVEFGNSTIEVQIFFQRNYQIQFYENYKLKTVVDFILPQNYVTSLFENNF